MKRPCVVCAAFGVESEATTRELSVETRDDGSIARVPPMLDVCAACAEVARSYPVEGEQLPGKVPGDETERGDADRDELLVETRDRCAAIRGALQPIASLLDLLEAQTDLEPEDVSDAAEGLARAVVLLGQIEGRTEASVDVVASQVEVDAGGMLMRGDKSSDANGAAERRVREVANAEASPRSKPGPVLVAEWNASLGGPARATIEREADGSYTATEGSVDGKDTWTYSTLAEALEARPWMGVLANEWARTLDLDEVCGAGDHETARAQIAAWRAIEGADERERVVSEHLSVALEDELPNPGDPRRDVLLAAIVARVLRMLGGSL